MSRHLYPRLGTTARTKARHRKDAMPRTGAECLSCRCELALGLPYVRQFIQVSFMRGDDHVAFLCPDCAAFTWTAEELLAKEEALVNEANERRQAAYMARSATTPP